MKKAVLISQMVTGFMVLIFPNLSIRSQTLTAVNDTVDLYRQIPVTVNLLANDTVPPGDSIKIFGGGSGSSQISLVSSFQGFYTYVANPVWGFSGTVHSSYTVRDYTISKQSTAGIVFRVHDDSFDTLDINNVMAVFNAYGNHFWSAASQTVNFLVPKNGTRGTLFASTFWIGGTSDDSTLNLAAERYRQGPLSANPGTRPDFYAGPVMDTSNYSIYQDTCWYRVWKVKKSSVEYHKLHWNDPGYAPPAGIAGWPGNGDPYYGQAQQLAPFHDRNGDQQYDPGDGDYPVIRGDEALFFIFNDVRDIHKETLGNKMGIEVHGLAYAFDLPDDSAFKNTIFVNYRIFNRSPFTYYNTYLGLFTDIDLGYPSDDYIGCDVERNSYFGYNGNPVDGLGYPGHYGAHPPAQAITILRGPLMDPIGQDRPRCDIYGNQLCNESVNGTGFGDGIADNERYGLTGFLMLFNAFGFPAVLGDPHFATEYYNNLKSTWADSSHLVYGGNGHPDYGGYGPECRFMYPGESDTLNWGTGCQLPNGPVNWTMRNVGNIPTDIRGLGTMGPFTFKPGDIQEMDFAFIFARDYEHTDTLFPSVSKLRQMIDIIRNSYNTGKLPGGNSFFGINEQQDSQSLAVKIFPNPADERVHIAFDRPVSEKVELRVVSSSGVTVFSTVIPSAGRTVQVDVSRYATGIYFITVRAGDMISTGKVAIIR